MLKAYLLFYQFSLTVFIKLNLLLQMEDFLISRVHSRIQRFLRKLAWKFLTLDVIDESGNPAQIGLTTPTIKRAVMLKRVFYTD